MTKEQKQARLAVLKDRATDIVADVNRYISKSMADEIERLEKTLGIWDDE